MRKELTRVKRRLDPILTLFRCGHFYKKSKAMNDPALGYVVSIHCYASHYSPPSNRSSIPDKVPFPSPIKILTTKASREVDAPPPLICW